MRDLDFFIHLIFKPFSHPSPLPHTPKRENSYFLFLFLTPIRFHLSLHRFFIEEKDQVAWWCIRASYEWNPACEGCVRREQSRCRQILWQSRYHQGRSLYALCLLIMSLCLPWDSEFFDRHIILIIIVSLNTSSRTAKIKFRSIVSVHKKLPLGQEDFSFFRLFLPRLLFCLPSPSFFIVQAWFIFRLG